MGFDIRFVLIDVVSTGIPGFILYIGGTVNNFYQMSRAKFALININKFPNNYSNLLQTSSLQFVLRFNTKHLIESANIISESRLRWRLNR